MATRQAGAATGGARMKKREATREAAIAAFAKS